jgi:hypothetical protein
VGDDGPSDPGVDRDGWASGEESRRRSRRLAWLYTAAAVILLPWIVYLAETLPRHQFDRHYRLAWVGFDVILVIAIIRTAYMAFRVDPRIQFPATATAVLLVVDAWFDVVTSSHRSQFFQALALAVLVELPSAIFTLYLAHRVSRRILELAHVDAAVPRRRWLRRPRSVAAAHIEEFEPSPADPAGEVRG